jgi:diguanylate cyclase (GGDEF)-like protein
MDKHIKRIAPSAVLLITALLLLLAYWRPTDLLAGALFAVSAALLLRRSAPSGNGTRRLRTTETGMPATPENKVIEMAEAAVANDTVANASALGSEFKRRQWQLTEAAVDRMLNMFLTILSGRLKYCTAAIFFPTRNDSYYLRRYVSKARFVSKDAMIVPHRGILGSLLNEGQKLAPFYEPNFTNKNSTLFYYDDSYVFKPEESIRSILLCPIEAAGDVRGILLADSTDENAFTEDDRSFFNNTARLMGEAVYYAYLNTKHRLEYKQLEAISDVEETFWKNLEFDAVLDKIRDIIIYAIPCDRLTISLKDEDKMSAAIVRAFGEDQEKFLNLKFQIGDANPKSIVSIAYTKEFGSGFSRNFSADRYEFRYLENEPRNKAIASFMAVPIGVEKQNRRIGMILVESAKRDAFTKFDIDLLSRIGQSAGLALENIIVIRKADALATYDALTGIYNRRQFDKILTTKISACDRYNHPVSLVLSDIDHFKKLNDTYGHTFGDTVLKGVAAKLESCIRVDIDAAARYGGEEFVLIIDKTDHNAAMESVDRIRQAIQDMTFRTTDGTEVKTSMSFGIASYPHHAREMGDLIKRADEALYSAKRNGRNRVEIY